MERIRHYADHPGFVAASVDATVAAVDGLVAEHGAAIRPRLVFVTHSIPTAMAETAGPQPRSAEGAYVDWHRRVAAEVTRGVAAVRGVADDHDLVYCSRSGPPTQPWLEPDVNDHLTALAEAGESAVVTVPIGFVSDHMEVIFDLDTEAAATARELGLPFARAATAGTHPAFVAALVDLLVERAAVARGELVDEPVTLPARWRSGVAAVGRFACLAGLLSQPAAAGPTFAVPALGGPVGYASRRRRAPTQRRRRAPTQRQAEYPRVACVVAARAERLTPACPVWYSYARATTTCLGPPPGKVMMATDYDAPRKTEEELNEDSIEELKTRRNDKNSGKVDEDEAEAAESFELPGADLSHEELTVRVLPQQSDEFTCAGCFLVRHRSQIAEQRANGNAYCYDCAG